MGGECEPIREGRGWVPVPDGFISCPDRSPFFFFQVSRWVFSWSSVPASAEKGDGYFNGVWQVIYGVCFNLTWQLEWRILLMHTQTPVLQQNLGNIHRWTRAASFPVHHSLSKKDTGEEKLTWKTEGLDFIQIIIPKWDEELVLISDFNSVPWFYLHPPLMEFTPDGQSIISNMTWRSSITSVAHLPPHTEPQLDYLKL